MFVVFNEATSETVGEFDTLEEAKAVVSDEPEDRFIHDDRRMVGHFTDDGGETWDTIPYGAAC
jgi:hypothetical protein